MNDKRKKFSIIIPCFNIGNLLDICLASLLNQTIGINNLEIIIVDDASNDNITLTKIKEYEKQYPETILLIINRTNMGPGGSRNIALKYATGEYTAFVDGDDWIAKDAFEQLYKLAKELNADVIEFGHKVVYSHDGAVVEEKYDDSYELIVIDSVAKRKKFVLPSDSTVVCWDKIYRTQMLKENNIVFAEHISYQEPPFSYLVRFFCEKYLRVKNNYYYYYKRPGSMSDIERYKKNRFNIIDGYVKLINEIKEKSLLDTYNNEAQFIFWCGAFYLPLFNMASANDFYSLEEFRTIQVIVSGEVRDICSNPYFKKHFSGMQIFGEITYVPLDENVFFDIKQLFFALTHHSG